MAADPVDFDRVKESYDFPRLFTYSVAQRHLSRQFKMLICPGIDRSFLRIKGRLCLVIQSF